jgi:hypothetical protein
VKGVGSGGAGFAEMADEEVAEADAGSGIVEGDAAGALDARGEVFELVGGGAVGEDEDFAGEE